jgi:two-component system sensor histidine kinase YesM
MKKQNSIKTKVAAVLMGMLIPLIILINFYNLYTVHILNIKISESNKNTLTSYCSNIEETLQLLQSRMVSFISLNINFKLLSQKSIDVDVHTQSYEIMQEYNNLIVTSPLICGCFIYSNINNVYREVFRSTFKGVLLKEALRNHFKKLTDNKERLLENEWKPLVLEGHHFLYLLKGYHGTFCIYIIDLDSIDFPQNNAQTDHSSELLLYRNNMLLTDGKIISKNDIHLKGKDTYYFSGTARKYMIIEQPVKYTAVRAAYLVEYKGVWGNLSYLQFLVSFISILSILLIPYSYHKLKQVFFKPMDVLVETMEEIKNGKMEARVNTTYTESEFLEVNNTFNSMIEQIKKLKIDTYENELNLKKTQLQYYQIQIKPHFYINCLKNMYGMIEEGKYEDTKKAIIYLSNHLRYMLKNTSMLVPIETEINYINNYIELQQLSMAYPPECSVNADPECTGTLIPAISILSFVENSVKHAVSADKHLCISIQINFCHTDEGDYLNINISDNGNGFSDEQLKHLNNYLDDRQPEQSIGIYNVIKRYLLYYGEGNVWFAFSNMNGSHIDIFIKKGAGETNEHANS